jgi:hypothetical protein
LEYSTGAGSLKNGSREGSNKNVNGTELLVDKVWIAGFCDGVDEPSNYTMIISWYE